MRIPIVSVPLPVDETLQIIKERFIPVEGDSAARISIVTGIHGDELEGQYVCYEVARRIKEAPEHLKGTVDLYPALNPLGIDSVQRGIPGFDLDMNRIFPGDLDGALTEYMAMRIVNDLKGSDLCIDVHSSNIFITEMPQIRINEKHKQTLLPLAAMANVDFVWIHGANTVLESTLAYSMNALGVPTLVVEMGVGMRLTPNYGLQLTDGLFNLMKSLGIWTGDVTVPRAPVISEHSEDIAYLNAPISGMFLKEKLHGSLVRQGERLGMIFNPYTGEALQVIKAPVSGLLFTIREYPVVDEGSLLARICIVEAE
ncbi:MAG: uncharacterized protein PWP38_1851 [Clostridiales bacterium]|jgi:predicted deacylase|nr:uncharacterized protein [Clostridiales bacterium]